MVSVNLGSPAHGDAGKTTLTGRILYAAGIIAATAAFHLNALNVSLIDPPGHGSFIAEVERRLRALDGAALLGAMAVGAGVR